MEPREGIVEDTLGQLVECVTDEASFVRFLRALAEDAEADAAEAARRPPSSYGPGRLGWENGTVGAFLESAAAWAEAKRQPSSPNPWRACADILLAGKSYE